ncbi:MAG: hypothetical protein JKX84_08010, partial [Flavobacteriales bacterium]|nr:hypothetical protein [Flavobacteriales bacterium]
MSLAKLDSVELSICMGLIVEATKEYNVSEEAKYRGLTIETESYYWQLVPAKNDAGEKFVWVNGFC